MTSPLLVLAVSIVRTWTRVYTWRMQPAMREARCAEVESDLWEFRRDPRRERGINPAVQVVVRMLLGMPDDLRWRAAHPSVRERPVWRTIALTATTAAVLLAALWIFDAMRAHELPRSPAPMRFIAAPPPPPPLPPSQPR
jgi:hypothetical protein